MDKEKTYIVWYNNNRDNLHVKATSFRIDGTNKCRILYFYKGYTDQDCIAVFKKWDYMELKTNE